MVQDIAPHEYHVEWSDRKCEEQDYIVLWEKDCFFLKDGKEFIQVKNYCEAAGKSLKEVRDNTFYLLGMDDRGLFVFDPEKPGASELTAAYKSMKALSPVHRRNVRQITEDWIRFLAVTGLQLMGWYNNKHFCGRCGHPMKRGTTERSMVCPECGLTEYPQLCPAVIVAITDGDRIVGSRYVGHDAVNHYALIAGYMEIGETYEDTIRREVMEEVGLKVKNFVYYESQPWSFSGSILSGFYCQLDGSDEIKVDHNELSDALWLTRDMIEDHPDDVSLTGTMLQAFKDKSYPMYEAWEKKK